MAWIVFRMVSCGLPADLLRPMRFPSPNKSLSMLSLIPLSGLEAAELWDICSVHENEDSLYFHNTSLTESNL